MRGSGGIRQLMLFSLFELHVKNDGEEDKARKYSEIVASSNVTDVTDVTDLKRDTEYHRVAENIILLIYCP